MRILAIICLILSLQFSPTKANAKGNNFINLKFNTFPLIIGANDVEVDLLIGNWALGANAYLLDFEDGVFGAEASLYGGQLSYFFSGANADGWMFNLKARTGSIDVTTTVVNAGLNLVSATGAMDVTIASAELGYQWMWSTFNMQFRAGMASYSGSDATVNVTDSSGNIYNTTNAFTNGTAASLTYTFGLAF